MPDSLTSDARRVWYPSVDDIIFTNFGVVSLGLDDKHPHRLLTRPNSIQAVLDHVRESEAQGVTYQAAQLMSELVKLHPFAGGNHRTAYIAACVFLKRNGRQPRVERFKDGYVFIKDLQNKTVQQIREWLEYGSTEESQRKDHTRNH
jgi:prophage maintenance system killer protein